MRRDRAERARHPRPVGGRGGSEHARRGVGFGALGGADPVAVGVVQAFAAGAILTMLADTMLPEAVDHAGPLVGLVTASASCRAFLLSQA